MGINCIYIKDSEYCTHPDHSEKSCIGLGCSDFKVASQISLGDSLKEAKKVISGRRQDVYGNPEDSFALIAKYWSIYLMTKPVDVVLTPLDIAHMMVLFKLARCSGQAPSRDNYIDIQGYAAIAADRLL